MPPYNLRGSWYSQLPPFGWFDNADRSGSNALGVPDSQQGIALPSRRTLGQWFNVTPPGATIPYPMQQTDTGPAPGTGRGVDISAAAAHQMGYTPQSFPTDAEFKVEPRDEPRGLGSPAGLPVQAGDLPDNATGGDAYASAGASTARKPMPSLMDMLSGNASPGDVFQSVDASGQPQSFSNALRGNSNSLIGLGMGLLQPRSMAVGAPAQSAWSNALGGYMQGAQADSANAYRQAALAHQKTQDARQAAMDRFNMNLQTQQFAENKLTEAEKLARATGLQPGTPEHSAFIKTAIQSKTEGDWTPQTDENTGQSYAYNKRTGETRAINVPGQTGTAVAQPDPFAPGTTNAPVYGSGPGGYSATQPSAPSSSSAQSGQGPLAGKTMREARSKAVIANEEDAVKSAKAAAEFKPALDEMTQAYEALAKAGGVGPIVGSGAGRAVSAVTGYGGANEALRQRYETAKGKVQAMITASQNKGEGSASNFERMMYGAQFPALNALDASTQLPFLRQLQAATDQHIAAGRGTSLGSSPGTLFTRPPIEQKSQSPTAGGGDPLSQARDAIKQGAPKAKVIERLAKQGIRFNPKDLD